MRRLLLPLACSMLLLGCPSDDKDQQMEELLAPPAAGKGMQLRMVSTLMPGQEIERCQFFVAPKEGLAIRKQEVRYKEGSHHVLLYTTSYTELPKKNRRMEDVDTSKIMDCSMGAAADWAITGVAGAAQSPDAPPIVDLPEGVAVRVPAGSVMLMNTHYLNASLKPMETDTRINLYTIPEAEVVTEAGLIFFYNPFIHIPGMAQASARMSCPVTEDITVINLQSHMHRRGVNYVANLLDAQGKVLETLYEGKDWENVSPRTYAPAKQLKAGMALDYRCDYKNSESRTVIQGVSTSDEMCMLLGLYYPRKRAFEHCALDDSGVTDSLNATFIGTGDKPCGQTLGCVQANGRNEEAFYECVVNGCEKSSKEISDALRCTILEPYSGSCKMMCQQNPAGCQACVIQACRKQIDACTAATCQ